MTGSIRVWPLHFTLCFRTSSPPVQAALEKNSTRVWGMRNSLSLPSEHRPSLPRGLSDFSLVGRSPWNHMRLDSAWVHDTSETVSPWLCGFRDDADQTSMQCALACEGAWVLVARRIICKTEICLRRASVVNELKPSATCSATALWRQPSRP
jgi:hypothetical protein